VLSFEKLTKFEKQYRDRRTPRTGRARTATMTDAAADRRDAGVTVRSALAESALRRGGSARNDPTSPGLIRVHAFIGHSEGVN
jgi:hypothetical protein